MLLCLYFKRVSEVNLKMEIYMDLTTDKCSEDISKHLLMEIILLEELRMTISLYISVKLMDPLNYQLIP